MLLLTLPSAVVDLQSLYPPHLVPTFMASLKAYYIATYNDLFFISPPPFFKLYMWFELFYQAPVMFWAIPNLYRSMYPRRHPAYQIHRASQLITRDRLAEDSPCLTSICGNGVPHHAYVHGRVCLLGCASGTEN
jgi:EXPERA (EXPanded EBP superfamily)